MTPGSIDPAGPLGQLASAHGVATSWVDDVGTVRSVARDTVTAIIGALIDETVSSDRDIDEALNSFQRHARAEIIAPVIIAEGGRLAPIELGVPGDGAILLGEDGSTRAAEIHGSSVRVTDPLEPGLYTLTVGAGGTHHVATVIAPPDDSTMGDAPAFGIGTNVSELRDRRDNDQGRGHIGLVDRFAELLGRHDITCVSVPTLLPHRLVGDGPQEGVMTRRGWADWVIDVRAAPGAAGLGADWSSARTGPDHAETCHRDALAVYADLVGDHPALRAELDRFLVKRSPAARYARFRALGETLSEDWRRWPAPWRSGDLSHAPVDERRELYHQVAQWQAATQIEAVVARLAERGQQLEMRLDIGVHPQGYDYWNQPHLFTARATTGRAPTTHSPGHNSLLPAARAAVGHSDGYRSFASAVRHQLVSGLLHVPALEAFHRSWWIPTGADPSDGTYVTQSGDELLAVVRLEAHREGATIVASASRHADVPDNRPGRTPPVVLPLREALAGNAGRDRCARPVEHVLTDPDVVGIITSRHQSAIDC